MATIIVLMMVMTMMMMISIIAFFRQSETSTRRAREARHGRCEWYVNFDFGARALTCALCSGYRFLHVGLLASFVMPSVNRV